MTIFKDDTPSSDGVNLLISILVRYPEIGSIRFNPENHSLQLIFLLSQSSEEEKGKEFYLFLEDSIGAFHTLTGTSPNLIDIQLSISKPVALLTVTRDIITITKNEIDMLIALLRDHFTHRLLTDYNESMLEEDLRLQENVIEDMLANIKKNQTEYRLIGIREDGRVMVFNK